MTKQFLAIVALLATSVGAGAQESYKTYMFDGDFDDATFAVENAIIDRGLVIDWTSHVGEMLDRTGRDLGSDVTVFDNADIFMFCSAVLSRKMMEADPMNIAFCPYGVFVADRDGSIVVGYRTLPDGIMQEVQSLLDAIALEATE